MGYSPWGPKEVDMTELYSMHTLPHYREQNGQVTSPFFFFFLLSLLINLISCPGGSEVKASASNAGDPGLIPGSGRSPGEGNGNPLQYSSLENPMDGEA